MKRKFHLKPCIPFLEASEAGEPVGEPIGPPMKNNGI